MRNSVFKIITVFCLLIGRLCETLETRLFIIGNTVFRRNVVNSKITSYCPFDTSYLYYYTYKGNPTVTCELQSLSSPCPKDAHNHVNEFFTLTRDKIPSILISDASGTFTLKNYYPSSGLCYTTLVNNNDEIRVFPFYTINQLTLTAVYIRKTYTKFFFGSQRSMINIQPTPLFTTIYHNVYRTSTKTLTVVTTKIISSRVTNTFVKKITETTTKTSVRTVTSTSIFSQTMILTSKLTKTSIIHKTITLSETKTNTIIIPSTVTHSKTKFKTILVSIPVTDIVFDRSFVTKEIRTTVRKIIFTTQKLTQINKVTSYFEIILTKYKTKDIYTTKLLTSTKISVIPFKQTVFYTVNTTSTERKIFNLTSYKGITKQIQKTIYKSLISTFLNIATSVKYETSLEKITETLVTTKTITSTLLSTKHYTSYFNIRIKRTDTITLTSTEILFTNSTVTKYKTVVMTINVTNTIKEKEIESSKITLRTIIFPQNSVSSNNVENETHTKDKNRGKTCYYGPGCNEYGLFVKRYDLSVKRCISCLYNSIMNNEIYCWSSGALSNETCPQVPGYSLKKWTICNDTICNEVLLNGEKYFNDYVDQFKKKDDYVINNQIFGTSPSGSSKTILDNIIIIIVYHNIYIF